MFLLTDQHKAMDAKENSKQQEQYTSPLLLSYPSTPNTSHIHSSNLYPIFSTMEFNVLKNSRANTKKSNSNFFVTCKGHYDVPPGPEHSFENSDSDSSSEGDASEEEVSLDELLLHDGKTKKKIEQLAAMVGVDTKEPAVVLSEVVRVLKHFKRINQQQQHHTTTTTWLNEARNNF